MAVYLVVHAADLRGNILPNVTATVDGTQYTLSTPSHADDPGSVEVAIGDNPKSVQVHVPATATTWPAEIAFTIVIDASRRPQAVVTNPSGLPFDTAFSTTRQPVDTNVHVHLTGLALKDATSDIFAQSDMPAVKALGTAGQSNGVNVRNFTYKDDLDFVIEHPALTIPPTSTLPKTKSPVSSNVLPTWELPVRTPTPADGWKRFRTYNINAKQAQGRAYVCERQGQQAPLLIYIWRPDVMDFPTVSTSTPSGIHMFFTPYPLSKDIKPTWGTYPLTKNYVHLGDRYFFTDHHLVLQHVVTGKKLLFVIPIGKEDQALMPELQSWSAVTRLLDEVNQFVLRTEGVGNLQRKLRPVGRIAMSAFSRGIQTLTPCLSSYNSSPDGKLNELYSFDGIEQGTPGQSPIYDGQVVTWLSHQAKGADVRFRSYVQSPTTLTLQVKPAGYDNWVLFVTPDQDAPSEPMHKTYSEVRDLFDAIIPTNRSVTQMPDMYWQAAITPSAPARTKGGAWESIASRYNGQAHHQILNRFMYSAIHFSGF